MRRMLEEFKAFALRGNVLELAIAVILGLAFSAVVTAFVDGIIMPIVAAMFGQPSFDGIEITLGDSDILVGTFLTAVVKFLLIAFALFLIVRMVNRAMASRSEQPAQTRRCPFCMTVLPQAATRCSACTSPLETPPVE